MSFKLIVSEDYAINYFIEYMLTFTEHKAINYSELCNYKLNDCEELIIVGHNRGIDWLPLDILKSPKKISVLNLEQLTAKWREERVCHDIQSIQSKCGYQVKVYDYSPTNCTILENHGFNVRFHPYLPTLKDITFLHSLHSSKKEYDLGFVGGISPRRQKIINELAKAGITLIVIPELFGNERDMLLAKSKYILNIAWSDDYKIFNSVRCNRWLQAGYKVISEDGLDVFYNSNLFLTSYDNLVDFIKNLLKQT